MKKHINILTKSKYDGFMNQFDKKLLDKYDINENSKENIIWDLVVVYEGINEEIKLMHKKNALLFISGEPEISRVYTKDFIEQFDAIITTHKNIYHKNKIMSQLSLDWHFALNPQNGNQKYSFQEISEMNAPVKSKNISIITSNKCTMPGHVRRLKLISFLKEKFGNKIDYFGIGSNYVEYKCDALLPYRFHICMENCESEHYWSEKLADAFLGFSVPIYSGCSNINKYFNNNSIIKFDINNLSSTYNIIENILQNPKDIYNKYLPYIIKSRELVLEKYNFSNVIIKYLEELPKEKERAAYETILKPVEKCKSFYTLNMLLRLHRFILKKYITIFE